MFLHELLAKHPKAEIHARRLDSGAVEVRAAALVLEGGVDRLHIERIIDPGTLDAFSNTWSRDPVIETLELMLQDLDRKLEYERKLHVAQERPEQLAESRPGNAH